MTRPAVPSESSAKAATSLDEPKSESLVASEAGGSSPRRRRRFKRRLLVPLLGLLVIVGAVGALVLPQFLASNQTETVWQSITSGITDGNVPKQTALEAFSYLFKVSIPGVTVPQGRDIGDAPTSGSGAMRWVRANWSSLTADQKAVNNRKQPHGRLPQASENESSMIRVSLLYPYSQGASFDTEYSRKLG